MTTQVSTNEGVIGDVEVRWPTILVIDDEPFVIDAIRRRLAQHNVEVMEAYHGYQGIWRAITEQPAAIITDIKMPHANGEEVIECLRRNPSTSDAPIFVLTGISDPGLKRRLLKRGVVGYFTKPADLDELLRELDKHVPVVHGSMDHE